jgi:hypothetical protein
VIFEITGAKNKKKGKLKKVFLVVINPKTIILENPTILRK